jgi:hypothetical protein
MKVVYSILLVIAIAVLGYLCVMSILTPIRFEEQREEREKIIIAKLIDIRKAEVEFNNQFRYYTANMDSLINFINTGKVAQVFKVGTLTDEQLKAGLTEQKAVKIVNSGKTKEIIANGLQNFRRDTTFVGVFESIFADKYSRETIAKLGEIPFSNGEQFNLQAGLYVNPKTGIKIPLFQATAHYSTYLNDLDKQERINLIDLREKMQKFPGLKVGDIETPNNNAGNWE